MRTEERFRLSVIVIYFIKSFLQQQTQCDSLLVIVLESGGFAVFFSATYFTE